MTKGLNEARAFLRQFRSMVDLAKVVDELGSVEEQLSQRKVEYEAASGLVDKARADMAEAEGRQRVAEAAIEEARQQRKDMISGAKVEAELIVQEAERRADEIVKKANEESNGVKDKTKALEAELARLDAEVAKRASELVDMQAAINKLRKKFAE